MALNPGGCFVRSPRVLAADILIAPDLGSSLKLLTTQLGTARRSVRQNLWEMVYKPHCFWDSTQRGVAFPLNKLTPTPPQLTPTQMSFIPVIPPKLSSPSVDVTPNPRMFVMPDLVSHCTFDLRIHEEIPRAVWETKAWMINGSNIALNEKTLNSLHGLKAGGQLVDTPSL